MAKVSKHVTKFKELHLKKGEQIIASSDGYIGNMMGKGDDAQHNGVLIVTETIVAFYRKGFFGEVLETIPLKNVTSIERKSFMGPRTIRIHTSHDDLEFKTFDKKGEDVLINAIESGRDEQQAALGTDSSNETTLDKLKKLGELKEAGIITDDEFSSKKHQLLTEI